MHLIPRFLASFVRQLLPLNTTARCSTQAADMSNQTELQRHKKKIMQNIWCH